MKAQNKRTTQVISWANAKNIDIIRVETEPMNKDIIILDLPVLNLPTNKLPAKTIKNTEIKIPGNENGIPSLIEYNRGITPVSFP